MSEEKFDWTEVAANNNGECRTNTGTFAQIKSVNLERKELLVFIPYIGTDFVFCFNGSLRNAWTSPHGELYLVMPPKTKTITKHMTADPGNEQVYFSMLGKSVVEFETEDDRVIAARVVKQQGK